MKARAQEPPETSYIYFMKLIWMQLYVGISEKDFLLQERSMLVIFIMTPYYDLE
jgi:hypothetical protein